MLFLVAGLILAAEPVAAVDAPPEPKVCEPLRDRSGRRTGGEVCKTAAEWKQVLRDHAQPAWVWNRVPSNADAALYNSSVSPTGGFARQR